MCCDRSARRAILGMLAALATSAMLPAAAADAVAAPEAKLDPAVLPPAVLPPAVPPPVVLPPVLGTTEQQISDLRSGLGLSGYDPVSYWLGAVPRPGDRRHEALRDGLGWRFVSAADKAAFLRDPETFTPRVGGYDAVAVAAGRVVDADPLIYVVQGPRLYLFRTAEGRAGFLADPKAAEAAELGWTRARTGLVRD